MPALSTTREPLVVVLLGPTASGKTALSLALARRFAGEIVSCDSVAVYREMDLGSAKPSREEQAQAPHHLIDVFYPDEQCTAGDYARLARAALAEIAGRGRLPIVTGGTGLYLRALVDGLFAGPQRSAELRGRLERSHLRHSAGWLWRVLDRLDPAAAAAIHANDTPKLVRAIEVSIAARRPMTEAWREQGRDRLTGYRILRIGLEPERKALYERINRRAARMFADGLVEETRELIARYGEFPGAGDGSGGEAGDRIGRGPMDALGYRQARAVLRGEMTEAEAITAAQQGHRNYAKRQLTWFRREPEVHWFRGFGDDAGVEAGVVELVEAALRQGPHLSHNKTDSRT